MEGESGVTRSIIDVPHSLDIRGDRIKGESGVTLSIIDKTSFLGYPRRSDGRWKRCYSKYH